MREAESGADGRRRSGRFPWAAAATAIALLACYGTTAFLAILSLLGLTLAVNEDLWVSVIAVAAVAAAAALWLNTRRHGRRWPALGAALGAALIIYAMFGAYHPVTEGLGFLALTLAVVGDLRLHGKTTRSRER